MLDGFKKHLLWIGLIEMIESEEIRVGNVTIRKHSTYSAIVVDGVEKKNIPIGTHLSDATAFAEGRLDITIEDVPAFIKTVYKFYKECKMITSNKVNYNG
jgi:hypothetical protein